MPRDKKEWEVLVSCPRCDVSEGMIVRIQHYKATWGNAGGSPETMDVQISRCRACGFAAETPAEFNALVAQAFDIMRTPE